MQIQLPGTVQGLKSATVRRWLKGVGQSVKAGETVVELEGEDALIELQASVDGVVARITAEVGTTVMVGGELGVMEAGAGGNGAASGVVATNVVHPYKDAGGANVGASGVPILMPQAGNSMEEGTLLKWRVKVGETVAVGQVICEVETDKATVEVEATAAGKIGWLAAEGAVVPVKQAIAILGGGAGASAPVTAVATTKSVATAGAASGAAPANVVPVLMPQAGNSMEEGTILKWKVKVGDRVTVGQILCEIETDKATIEMEATDAGRVAKIVAAEGSVVPVKQAIAYLAESDADVAGLSGGAVGSKKQEASGKVAGAEKVASPAVVATAVTPAARMDGGRVKASPAARKMAGEKGIDLAGVGAGSGPGGRILSTDLVHVKAGVAKVAAAANGAGASAAQAAAGKAIASAGPMAQVPSAGGVNGRRAMSKMRKAIATNLQTSKQTVPHFYVKLTINADPLFAFYKAQKSATGSTLNDVMLLAVGRVVGEFPAFRSRLEGNEIVEVPSANIGVAVSVADGLVVPVVMGIHGLTLGQLVVEAKRVVESARNGKIENMGKGVFTISNMGMLGVEDFSAIINPPESGILAISAVREAVIVKDGAMKAGRVMSLTLSVDHRVVDGALAAQFMARLRELLEMPEKLLG